MCIYLKIRSDKLVTIDRRILKSQEAIKSALVKLMSQKEFDKITVKDICIEANVGNRTFYLHYLDKYNLLDKLVEGHMEELKRLCEPVSDNNYKAAHMIWFEYLKTHYLFFSTMLSGQGAFAFRKHFLNLIIEEIKSKNDLSTGKNQGIDEELMLNFLGSAIVGVVENYLLKGMTESIEDVSKQLGILTERNL